MNKISRFVKLALFSSAFALIAVSSLIAAEAGGSCQPPKDTVCGDSGGPFVPYGNYTPEAN